MIVLKIMLMVSAVYGTVKTADMAWGLGDIGVGMMAWLNIIAILLMGGTAFNCLRDYEKQMSQNADPVFDPERLSLQNADYWTEHRDEVKKLSEPGPTFRTTSS